MVIRENNLDRRLLVLIYGELMLLCFQEYSTEYTLKVRSLKGRKREGRVCKVYHPQVSIGPVKKDSDLINSPFLFNLQFTDVLRGTPNKRS